MVAPSAARTASRDEAVVAECVGAEGFAIVPGVLDDRALDTVEAAIELLAARGPVSSRAVYGVRDLLAASPVVRQLAAASVVRRLAVAVLGEDCFAVRAILFDKTPAANWMVPWHQDVTIAVAAKVDAPNFGPWSVKGGVVHVQPPAEVLERMATVRIHIDDCGAENAPLRVVPGSHRLGRLATGELAEVVGRSASHACCVPRGGALLMRPLLVHASSRARTPAHRRVVHLEYAAGDLPGGLEWSARLR